ncbi:MAG: hypothetical protein RPR98_01345, partial [Bermanella sp.]
MIDPRRKSLLPFGTATLVFLGAALIYQWWPVSACDQLEDKLQKGYFLRWLSPQLMLITADKKSLMVQAQNKQSACELMVEKI